MRQTKESNKRAPGRVVIHISVHLVLIYTLTFSNVLLVLALNLIVHKPSYCKCSLAWCQSRAFLLFTIGTHPLQMREHPLQYATSVKINMLYMQMNGQQHYQLGSLNWPLWVGNIFSKNGQVSNSRLEGPIWSAKCQDCATCGGFSQIASHLWDLLILFCIQKFLLFVVNSISMINNKTTFSLLTVCPWSDPHIKLFIVNCM